MSKTQERYRVVRMFFKGRDFVVLEDCTLEEAQAHCRNPETSSSTCSPARARAIPGQWFDGYDKVAP